jgi:hypothetical protein
MLESLIDPRIEALIGPVDKEQILWNFILANYGQISTRKQQHKFILSFMDYNVVFFP